MDYLFNFIPKSNFGYVNYPHFYNSFFQILELFKDDKESQKKIIEIIKINIGNQFINNMKDYFFKKLEINHYFFTLV